MLAKAAFFCMTGWQQMGGPPREPEGTLPLDIYGKTPAVDGVRP